MITRANRGRRYPIVWDKVAEEAQYLTTACLKLRARREVCRYQEQTAKALAAFRKRHEPTLGCPTGWRRIALGRIHSAGIADQYAEFYRVLISDRLAGTALYLGLPELEATR